MQNEMNSYDCKSRFFLCVLYINEISEIINYLLLGKRMEITNEEISMVRLLFSEAEKTLYFFLMRKY